MYIRMYMHVWKNVCMFVLYMSVYMYMYVYIHLHVHAACPCCMYGIC
jgi:hypothetical protein